jgi:hypothetical protein
MYLISEVVTSGSQATVTFSGIPASYRELIIRVRGRGTTNSVDVGVTCQFNGDTGPHYDSGYLQSSGAAVTTGSQAAADSMTLGYICAANAPANNEGGLTATVFDYRGTTFNKCVSSVGAEALGTSGAVFFNNVCEGNWRSTAAIGTATIGLAAGNFVNNSVVSLYGNGAPVSPYPAGVIAAGLESVYNNRTSSGLTGPLLYTPAANSDLLPAGSSWSAPHLVLVPPFSMSDWDFTDVFVDQNGSSGLGEYTNCKFGGNVPLPYQLAFALNKEGGSSNATLNNCLIDGTGYGTNFDAMFEFYANGVFTDNGCRWQNSSINFVTFAGGGPHIFQNGYMQLPATNGLGNSGTHVESVHPLAGSATFRNYLLDWGPAGIAADFIGGIAGPIFVEGYYGNVSVTVQDCVVSLTGSPVTMDFPPGSGNYLYWPLRVGGDGSNTGLLTVSGTVVQGGAGGLPNPYSLAGTNGTVVDGGGNYDYATGAPINVGSVG